MNWTTASRIAVVMLAGVAILVVLVPFLPGYDPYSFNIAAGLAKPLSTVGDKFYFLGSDKLGRDLLSRMALAGRVTIVIGLAAVAISLVVGVTLGLIAGFFRGWIESVVIGLADLQLSIPRVLLVIAVTSAIGSTVVNLTILLGLTSWVAYGRVARAMALTLREREFVLSATTQGATPFWNIRKHMLPNVMPQMLIVGSYELGAIVVLESALSYLGLGVRPPLVSWGQMISDGQSYLDSDSYLCVLPGIALFLLIAGVQFISQSLTPEGEEERRMSVKMQ